MDKMTVPEMFLQWVYHTNNGGFGQWIYNGYRKTSNKKKMMDWLDEKGYTALKNTLTVAFKSRARFGSPANFERATIWGTGTESAKEWDRLMGWLKLTFDNQPLVSRALGK